MKTMNTVFLNQRVMNKKEIDEILREKFLTKEKFVEHIENLVRDSGLNYIDAIVFYCETNNVEIETVPKLINRQIREKLQLNATDLNFLVSPSRARLPI